MRLNRVSLRARLVATLVILAALGLVASGVVINHQLQTYLMMRVDNQLAAGEDAVLIRLGGSIAPGDADRPPPPGPGAGPSSLPSGTYGAIFTPNGQLVTQAQFDFAVTSPLRDHDDSPSAKLTPKIAPDLIAAAASKPRYATVPSGSDDLNYRVLLAPNGGRVLAIGIPLVDIDATLTQLLWLEIGVGLGALILLGGLAYIMVRTELRPLDRMSATAAQIAASALTEDDLKRRVDSHAGGTEVSQLGDALNQMLTEIDASFAAREAAANRLRQFIADASHELRTPLTSIRGYAEMFDRGASSRPDDLATAMRRIEQESERMSVLVDDLLLLARLDQQRVLAREPVEIAPIVSDIALDTQAVFPRHIVSVETGDAITVLADASAMRQVVTNLAHNACVHTPDGTAIEIVTKAAESVGIIHVVDHGLGIPVAIRDDVFERFTRADSSRDRQSGGSGLGLAIVAALVTAMGGTVALSETPGGGATITVTVPLA